MVLLNHASHPAAHSWLVKTLLETAGNGGFGVFVFFIISGFLITTLLLREEHKTGRISLAGFYLRRAFRILPAYYVFLGTVALLGAFGCVDVGRADLLHAVTFTWLYFFGRQHWVLEHTWSLSVEEQFYLVWPLALLVLSRNGRLRFGLAVILITPLVRWLIPAMRPGAMHRVCHIIDVARFDALMIGSLPAILWSSPKFQQTLTLALRSRLHLVIVIGALMFCSPSVEANFGRTLHAAEPTIKALGAAALVFWSIRCPNGAFGRFLNLRAVKALGWISFSVYLWQQIFLSWTGPYLVTSNNLVNVALAIGLRHCSLAG